MVDEGELDWKVLCVRESEESKYPNGIEDVPVAESSLSEARLWMSILLFLVVVIYSRVFPTVDLLVFLNHIVS